jgi:hypothetical protein
MHVHFSSHFVEALEEAMSAPSAKFRIALTSIEEESDGDNMVSVAAVIRTAKLMSTFSSLQIIKSADGASSLHLAYEVGRALAGLGAHDRVIVLSADERLPAVLEKFIVINLMRRATPCLFMCEESDR